LYEHVAEKIKQWNKTGCCGAVVGATYPEELKQIREILGEEIPLLIPGIGAQGGDVQKTVENGTDKDGKMAIINSSRGIIYADSPRKEALYLRDEINKHR
jgi:orotidine-5'-phosphate decarboxylase